MGTVLAFWCRSGGGGGLEGAQLPILRFSELDIGSARQYILTNGLFELVQIATTESQKSFGTLISSTPVNFHANYNCHECNQHPTISSYVGVWQLPS